MRKFQEIVSDLFKSDVAQKRDFELLIRLRSELRPDIIFFYHHLREGMKLQSWISEKHLELTANGFLICRLNLDKYSFSRENIRSLSFTINAMEKQKYSPIKMLEIKVIE